MGQTRQKKKIIRRHGCALNNADSELDIFKTESRLFLLGSPLKLISSSCVYMHSDSFASVTIRQSDYRERFGIHKSSHRNVEK